MADLRHERVAAIEIGEDGTLRIYRRRGLFGLLRRQSIGYQASEWQTVTMHPSGEVAVTRRVPSTQHDQCQTCGGRGHISRDTPERTASVACPDCNPLVSSATTEEDRHA